jgi:hypothetical protein
MHSVAIVVSEEFTVSSTLTPIAITRHAWVLHTQEAEEIAQWFWNEKPTGDGDPLESGVTLFRGDGEPESDLLSVLDDVELHHGALSHDPPVGEIVVYGTALTDAVRDAFVSLGFSSFEQMPDIRGFVAYRKAAGA